MAVSLKKSPEMIKQREKRIEESTQQQFDVQSFFNSIKNDKEWRTKFCLAFKDNELPDCNLKDIRVESNTLYYLGQLIWNLYFKEKGEAKPRSFDEFPDKPSVKDLKGWSEEFDQAYDFKSRIRFKIGKPKRPEVVYKDLIQEQFNADELFTAIRECLAEHKKVVVRIYGRGKIPLIKKVNGVSILNSSTYHNRPKMDVQIQEKLLEHFKAIPFQSLMTNDFEVLDSREPEIFTVYDTGRKRLNNIRDIPEFDENGNLPLVKRHFAGALLFRDGERYRLMDQDREELKYNIENIFISDLPYLCKTIEQAYNALRPEAVAIAIEHNKEVIRSGEFFFIKSDENPIADLSEQDIEWGNMLFPKYHSGVEDYNPEGYSYYKKDPLKAKYLESIGLNDREIQRIASLHQQLPTKKYIKLGRNNPICVDEVVRKDNKTYARGWVKNHRYDDHPAIGEHQFIFLQRWYEVVPNREISSMKVSGQVD